MCGVVFFLSILKPMSMSDTMYVSKDAFEKMRQELQQMKSVNRPAASRAIAEAREKGDLKENAEYDAAKEAQGILEAKIALLETQIASSRIIDESEIDTSKVSILTRVTITNIDTKKTVTYQIVGEKEADLKAGKISVGSPIGQGLLGKARGDIAEVKAIVKVFGDHAYSLNISSTKSMTGHCLGAAGVIEGIACILSVKNDLIPPTINHFDDDPELDSRLNFTFWKAQKRTVNAALSNTFGFGGHNACVIVKKYKA